MALLEIRLFPDPVLRKRAREIKLVDASIRRLARDMIETMQAANGVGLAANQVGVLKRLIVLQMPEEDPRVMVNPEITRREGERQVDEGCLSFPGYVGLVRRSIRIKARALDESGGKIRIPAEELLAQAIEHEVDHLNGILFPDHLVEHEKLRRIEDERAQKEDAAQRSETGTHMHDVGLDLIVEHHDGASGKSAMAHDELLSANATFSRVTPRSEPEELEFEVTEARGREERGTNGAGKSYRRVRSADPAINGGALLDTPDETA